MQPPPAGDVLSKLRSATGGAHQRLEDAVQIERCVASRELYRKLLESFFGFYGPLEQRLAALSGWEAHGIDFEARRKTPWLEHDLLALGASRDSLKRAPLCGDLLTVDGVSAGFGALYVLEGATLGGRQIAAMMRTSPVPAGARAFFSSYGADTGARWREFVRALEAFGARADSDHKSVLRGAQETFAGLQNWTEREAVAA